MAAHRYWRLYITAAQNSVETDITELYLYETVGGARITGGTASADSEFNASYVAANAFDGTGSTWASTATAMPHWLKIDFGAGGAKDVAQWGIQSIATVGYTNYTPKTFSLQYSDDNVNWISADTRFSETGWSASETRQWTVPPASFGHRFWRLYITAVTGYPHLDLTELIMRTEAGGAQAATGGVPIYSNQSTNFEASKAFDGLDSTSWYVNQSSFPVPQWLGYDFGSNKSVVQYALKCWNVNETPQDFQFQWSDDGVNWTTADTRSTQIGWTVNEVRAFDVPPEAGTLTTRQAQSASASASVSGAVAPPDPLGLDVIYLGQIFNDLDPSSSTALNTTLDVVYLAEPIGPRGSGPITSDSTGTTRQGQTASSSAAVGVDVLAATSQGQTVNGSGTVLTAGDTSVTTRQGQSAQASGGTSISAGVTTGQAQAASLAAGVRSTTTATTSQGQTSSAQASAFTPWQLVSSAHIDSRDGSDSFPPFNLAAGNHVVVSVWLTGYTNPVDGSPDTSTSRAWTLSVSDTAGNSYVGLTPVRDQVVIGYPQFPVKWQYQFYCVNALGNASNVLTVAPVSPPPNPYDASHPTMFSTVTVLNSGGPAAEFGSTASAASTNNGAGSLSLPAMTVQPGASVLLDSASNGSTTESAPGWTLTDQFFTSVYAYWRANNSAATQNTTVTGDGGIRLLSAIALRNAQGIASTTRQGQTSSASVELSYDFVTSSVSTSQAQSSAASGSTGVSAAITTAQGQRAQASASSRLVAQVSTSQAQASSAAADVFQPGASGTSQAQSAAAQAGVSSAASSTSSQVQGVSGVAEVSLDAGVAVQQAQHATGQLAGDIGSSVTTSSAQHAAGLLASAYVLDAATSQAQQLDAQAGVESIVQGATTQGQGAAAEASVGVDTSATTDQRQRVRSQMRAEAINTVEGGQAQHASGTLGLSSDAPVATRQGQASSVQAGVAADSQVEAGQAQHIGDGNVLVVSTDAIVTTAQDAQHAAAVLEQYQPQQGTLSLGDKRVHVGLAGTVQPRIVLDAAIRVRPVLTGRVDLRPDL